MQRVLAFGVAACLGLVTGPTAVADSWARKLFEETSHDFGSVARSAKVNHAFTFTNTLAEDVHIRGVRVSCGCTTPKVERHTVAPGEKSAITAKLNTRSFRGKATATITVVFDRPDYTEVQLNVRGYIRRDVVLAPGGIDFGSIREGEAVERTIDLQYAGRNDWRIERIVSPVPYVVGEARETRRDGYRVSYRLAFRLTEDAPPGHLNSQLILEANDRRLSRVPVSVTGHVTPVLKVSPVLLWLGNVDPGKHVSGRLFVRGPSPFRITKIECDDVRFGFEITDDAKAIHFIPVIFYADGARSKISRNIQVHTDLLGAKMAKLVTSVTIIDH